MRASKIYTSCSYLFIYYMYIVQSQDKNENRMDLNWFKHSIHQISMLTSYAGEERDLSQADSLYQIL